MTDQETIDQSATTAPLTTPTLVDEEQLRETLKRLEAQVQEEKAAMDKAFAARVLDESQIADINDQIEDKKKELEKLEKDCEALMSEGRMYQLASRVWDFPLRDKWTDKPEQALVVDLSRFSRQLGQDIIAIASKDPNNSMPEKSKKRETIEVTRIKPGSLDLKTKFTVYETYEDVLKAACTNWSGLDPNEWELEDVLGRKLVRRDIVPSGTTSLILRYLEVDDGDIDDTTIQMAETEDGSVVENTAGSINNINNKSLSVGSSSTNVLALKDSMTTRDSRICYHFELLIVILLATTFATMSLEFRKVQQSYIARENVKRIFADQPVVDRSNSYSHYNNQFNFFQVSTEVEMWAWIYQFTEIVSSVNSQSLETCSLNPNITVTMFSNPTINQLRVPPNSSCTQISIGGVIQPCFSYFSSPQQIVPYPDPLPSNVLINSAFVFNASKQNLGSCSSWPLIVTDTFPGLYEYYPAKQLKFYSLNLLKPVANDQVKLLQNNTWVDSSTRLVAVSFTTFDSSIGLFVNVLASFEYLPNGGGVYPRWISIPFFQQVNDQTYDTVFIAFVSILVAISYLDFFVKKKSYSSITFFSIDSLLIIFVSLYYAGNIQMVNWFNSCQFEIANENSIYFDFTGVAFQYQLVGNLMGVIVTLFAVRLLKHLDSSPSTSLILRSFGQAFQQYVSLLFFLLILVSCFALMAHFIFGRNSQDFFVADLAYASLWISFSISNSAAYVGTNGWGAIILSITSFIVLFLFTFFLCFSVSASAYISVSDEVRSKDYFWMKTYRDGKRYEEILDKSGTIQGEAAEERRKNYQASKRTYGE